MEDSKLLKIIAPKCIILVKDSTGKLLYSNVSNPALFLETEQDYFYIGRNYYKKDIFLYTDKTILLFTDITEYTKDYLTGALNRFGFEIHLRYLEAKPYILALCDIDYFKKVNDDYGHKIGDYVLQKIASLIETTMEKEGLLARYGGEEFIVLMPHKGCKEMYHLLETLRKKVEASTFIYQNHHFHVTLTIGVSCYDPLNDNITRTIEEADQAMYEGKEKGRNKIVLCTKKEL